VSDFLAAHDKPDVQGALSIEGDSASKLASDIPKGHLSAEVNDENMDATALNFTKNKSWNDDVNRPTLLKVDDECENLDGAVPKQIKKKSPSHETQDESKQAEKDMEMGVKRPAQRALTAKAKNSSIC
jgi:hypothetical protein